MAFQTSGREALPSGHPFGITSACYRHWQGAWQAEGCAIALLQSRALLRLTAGAASQGAQWRLDHAAGWEASAQGQMQLHHSNTQPDSHGVQPKSITRHLPSTDLMAVRLHCMTR